MLRRNMSNNSLGMSSTESEDSTTTTMSECSKINVHLIADSGCGKRIYEAYQSLLTMLDDNLKLIFASERNIQTHDRTKTNSKLLPTLAILLFFNDDADSNNNPPWHTVTSQYNNNENRTGNLFKQNSNYNQQGNSPDSLEQLGIYIIEDDESVLSDCESTTTKPKIRPLERAREQLDHHPWKFHHEERPKNRISLCSENKQAFHSYTRGGTSDDIDYPLVGARKMHYGKQILRFTLFVDSENWDDQIDFYKLILGKKIVAAKEDFHYFTVWSTDRTEVEFALKKINVHEDRVCLRRTVLEFNVENLPLFVPLLPHDCNPISKHRWQTKDYEGNLILFQAEKNKATTAMTNVMDLFTKVTLPSYDNKKKVAKPDYKTLPNPKKLGRAKKGYCTYYSDTEDVIKHKYTLERSDSFEEPKLPQRMPLLRPSLYTDISQRFPLKWGQTSSLPDMPTKHELTDICTKSTNSDICDLNSPSDRTPSPQTNTTNITFKYHSPLAKKREQSQATTQHSSTAQNHHKHSPYLEKPNENLHSKTAIKSTFQRNNVRYQGRNKWNVSNPMHNRDNYTHVNAENANVISEKVANLIIQNTVDVDDVEIYV